MKKFLTMLALALMTVVMAVTVAGCANTSAPTKEDFNALIERVEELEEQNKNLNVFWTDKKEYSETETMTVYFGKTAVFKIRLKAFEWVNTSGNSSRGTINIDFYLTSLCAEILEDSIVTATYLSWNSGSYVCGASTNSTPPVIKQNVEELVGRSYKGDGAAYNNATNFNFIICVPGTPFELARFKNVSVKK